MNLPDYLFDLIAKTQRPTATVTNGSVAVNYSDNLASVAIRLVVAGGNEHGGVGRLNSQSPFRIYFQGAPDVTAKDRVIYGNRVFDIQNVNNFDEAGAYTRCDATEVQPSGVGA